MMHLIAGRAGFRQGSACNHLAVVGGSLVEIHDREKVGALARLITGADEQVPGRARRALPLALLTVLLPGGCGGNGQQHAETKKSRRAGRYATR